MRNINKIIRYATALILGLSIDRTFSLLTQVWGVTDVMEKTFQPKLSFGAFCERVANREWPILLWLTMVFILHRVQNRWRKASQRKRGHAATA